MGNSNSKKVEVTDQDRAVLELKVQRDKIRQYQKRIQVVLDREHAVAKECLAKGDKQRALLALRKRKYQEQLMAKTDEQLASLQELTRSIEFALVQKDVLYGLEQGNKVLKQLNKEMSLERVERIMDESADAVAYQQEVSDMLSGVITNSEEDEVQEELDALEREALGLDKVSQLPQPPKHVRVDESEQTEEREEEEEQKEAAEPRRQAIAE